MKQKICLLVAFIAIISLVGNAAPRRFPMADVIKTMLQNDVKTQLEHRFDKRQVLDIKQFMAEHEHPICLDGINICHVGYENKDGLTLSIEKLGNDTVFVYRNAIDDPVEVYYCTKRLHDPDELKIYIYYILAGNYMLANGKNALFGVWQDFYLGKELYKDPGIYRIYKIGNNKIEIIFGFDRVSNGAPNSGDMPGAGGAGAICPFLKWDLRFTADGLEAQKTYGDDYVTQLPGLAKGTNVLTKAQCPWQGIDGKWAFTAVMPLTHSLLKLFPKDALELMYAEIYARHGNKFEDAKYQKYFEAQPWYKKSKEPEELTDIEQFNADLINEVIMSML